MNVSYVSILVKNSLKYTLFTPDFGPWNKDLGSTMHVWATCDCILSRNGRKFMGITFLDHIWCIEVYCLR